MTDYKWGKYELNKDLETYDKTVEVGRWIYERINKGSEPIPRYSTTSWKKTSAGWVSDTYVTDPGLGFIGNPINRTLNLSSVQVIQDGVFFTVNDINPIKNGWKTLNITSPGKYEVQLYEEDNGINLNFLVHEHKEFTRVGKTSRGYKIDTVTSTNRNAYPNNGESGSYWYVYEGIANQTPTISGKDEDLGGFKAPFKKVFSVNDPDGNETLNVVVKLNSATIRTINNATKRESYEIDIDKAKFDELELNKENTIEITVSDSNGASAIRRYTFKKVNSNPVVTVTNSNLGEQNKPFNFSFKAADPDGDDITVKVYVDDVQLQDLGKVTPNQSKTVSIGKLDYAKLLNGEHRIKIEATDSFGAKGTGYITFSKKVTHCWYKLTKEVDAQPTAVVVNPLTELAKGAKMTVKVSLNAKDKNPTWEVVPEELIGQKYNFKTKTKTADKWCIGVDIRIDRVNTPEGMSSYFYGFVGAYM